METHSSPLDAFKSKLVSAINRGELQKTSQDLLADSEFKAEKSQKAVLRQCIATCERITSETDEVKNQVLQAFERSGIGQPSNTKDQVGNAQFHSFELAVSPSNLKTAMQQLKALGFGVDDLLIDRTDQLAVHGSELVAMKQGALSVRATLKWRNLTKFQRKLAPNPVDIAYVKLPGLLGVFYSFVSPIRKVHDLIAGQRTEDRLKLKAASHNLGTPEALISKLLALLELTADDLVFDLGCADGRILLSAAREFGCQCVGIERNRPLVEQARECVSKAGLDSKISVIEGDIKQAELEKATVVFLFLPPKLLNRVLNDIRPRLESGTRVIAHEQLPVLTDWAPYSIEPVLTENALTVAHVWKVDAG